MADRSDWLARVVKGLDQRDRNGIVGQVPHGAVPTHVENSIEIFGFYITKPDRVRKCSLGCENPFVVTLIAGTLSLGCLSVQTAAAQEKCFSDQDPECLVQSAMPPPGVKV